ncbi:MAG: RES family NAD+ phosphorylase [Candidatus Binatia bacterium]
MALTPPLRRVRRPTTHRLVASRWPATGILDTISAAEDLEAVADLEGWTNDRLQEELGPLTRIPREEWVVGTPHASVVMAAFCHPAQDGGRFSSAELGAWYAAFTLATAHAEAAYRRRREFDEVARAPLPVQMREYRAGIDAALRDVRPAHRYPAYHHPTSYRQSQRLGIALRRAGSNGLVYESVRAPGSDCLVVFWPRLVRNVRVGCHFEYTWPAGATGPTIRRLG